VSAATQKLASIEFDDRHESTLREYRVRIAHLFAELSRLIYTIISQFYAAAAGKPLLSGLIAAH
jgi:hypothetical protein